MDLTNLLRAKSEREEGIGKNILLKDHIIETLKRARQLKEFVEINDNTVIYSDLKDEKFFTALAIALILHDFGKINYDFQMKVHSTESNEWKELKSFFESIKNIKLRHEILSAIWASIILEDVDEWKEWFSKIRTAILLHHYNEYYIGEKDLMEIVLDYLEDVKQYVKFIIDKRQDFMRFLNEVIRYIREKFTHENFINNALEIIRGCKLERAEKLLEMIEKREDDISGFAEFYKVNNESPDYNFFVFLGCLRRCDYSASSEVDVEKTNIKLKEIYKDLEERIKEKIGVESLWQEKLIKKIGSMKSIVLVAPTGSGKTEFALLWNKNNSRKLIYTLPLRVALNDLFVRFKYNYFSNNIVDILHSTAFIEYLEEGQKRKRIDIEKQLTASKLLSSPILLTTPDQVFLTSLNYYGSDKVISVYPFSSIVIDEIQTYDSEMASIIIKTLQIAKKLGGTILIMTATLPPYFEPFFFNSKSKDYDVPKKFRLGFEKVDTEVIKDDVKNYNLKRHKIKVVNDWLTKYVKESNRYLIKVNEERLKEYITKYNEKNVFIVLNNVSKAIKVYERLKGKYPNIFLLHSRLIEKEKERRIKLIKLLLKKSKSEKDVKETEKLRQEFENLDINKPIIVVTTQIIEASVDLDFDVMITEVSPIDSQVQRWGRIYRNRGNEDYNEKLENIVVFIGISGAGKIDRGTGAIYDKRVVEKTIEILREFEGRILSYSDERRMIEEVFKRKVKVDDSNLAKSVGNVVALKDLYVEEIKRNLEFLRYFQIEKKSQAQRLFRRIAGIQVLIPTIMKFSKDQIDRMLAEIIESTNGCKKSWKELEKDIGVNRFELKKRLYQYSVSIPIFYFDELRSRINHEFKGFSVLTLSGAEAKKVLEYGIDKDVIKKSEEEYLSDIFI